MSNLNKHKKLYVDFSKDTFEEDDFDWELYRYKDNPKLEKNTKIIKKEGDPSIVYSHEPYAQDLYDSYMNSNVELQEPVIGGLSEGVVTQINDRFAMVDVNWREDIKIDLHKENPEYIKYIQKDFPIEVYIDRSKVKKNQYEYTGSYTKNIQEKKLEEIKNSVGEDVAYPALVKRLVHGGYFVEIDGVECFMPGSLGGMNKLIDFSSLLNKTIYTVPINFSKDKGYVVVSHRAFLQTLIPSEISKLVRGKKYKGFVTGCSRHGIFVEFNDCLTGLVPKSEIDGDLLIKFEERSINAGSEITFYLLDIINNKKISLSIKKPAPVVSAWDDINDRYELPTYVTGKIKRVVKYGVFIEIEPRVVGLLHKSHIEKNLELEVGEEIEVKIVKIDSESKKVDFTM